MKAEEREAEERAERAGAGTRVADARETRRLHLHKETLPRLEKGNPPSRARFELADERIDRHSTSIARTATRSMRTRREHDRSNSRRRVVFTLPLERVLVGVLGGDDAIGEGSPVEIARARAAAATSSKTSNTSPTPGGSGRGSGVGTGISIRSRTP